MNSTLTTTVVEVKYPDSDEVRVIDVSRCEQPELVAKLLTELSRQYGGRGIDVVRRIDTRNLEGLDRVEALDEVRNRQARNAGVYVEDTADEMHVWEEWRPQELWAIYQYQVEAVGADVDDLSMDDEFVVRDYIEMLDVTDWMSPIHGATRQPFLLELCEDLEVGGVIYKGGDETVEEVHARNVAAICEALGVQVDDLSENDAESIDRLITNTFEPSQLYIEMPEHLSDVLPYVDAGVVEITGPSLVAVGGFGFTSRPLDLTTTVDAGAGTWELEPKYWGSYSLSDRGPRSMKPAS